VVIEAEALEDLVFLAAHDDDPFARYEAMQSLIVRHLVAAASGGEPDARRAAERGDRRGDAAILSDEALDDLMRGELLILPPRLSGRAMAAEWSPAWCRRARGLKAWLGASWARPLRAA
jgi:aminopeptidase N